MRKLHGEAADAARRTMNKDAMTLSQRSVIE